MNLHAMILTFSPQIRSETLALEKKGDTLSINGVDIDFSPLLPGYKLPFGECQTASPLLLGAERSTEGDLSVQVLLPISANATEAAKYPQPIINPADGEIEVPK